MQEQSPQSAPGAPAQKPRTGLDIHEAIAKFRAARRSHHEQLAEPQRRRDQQLLADLTRILIDHAGDDVVGACELSLAQSGSDVLQIRAKHHSPVLMRQTPQGLRFDVRRGPGIRTFEHLGDALEFGQPYTFPNAGERPISFDTAKLQQIPTAPPPPPPPPPTPQTPAASSTLAIAAADGANLLRTRF